MSRKAATTLAALLVFGTASAVLADANDRTDYLGSFGQRPVSMMSNGRSGAVNDAAKPFTTEKNASFAASEPAVARSVPFRRGTTGKTIVWIKLTEPGGNLIHVNLDHITSIRSATLIPKARAQLDLASGKLQGVQASVEQVMQLWRFDPDPRPACYISPWSHHHACCPIQTACGLLRVQIRRGWRPDLPWA